MLDTTKYLQRINSDKRVTLYHVKVINIFMSCKDNKTHSCYISLDKLAECTSIKKKHLSKITRELQKWGYLEKQPHKHPNGKKGLLYLLNINTTLPGKIIKAEIQSLDEGTELTTQSHGEGIYSPMEVGSTVPSQGDQTNYLTNNRTTIEESKNSFSSKGKNIRASDWKLSAEMNEQLLDLHNIEQRQLDQALSEFIASHVQSRTKYADWWNSCFAQYCNNRKHWPKRPLTPSEELEITTQFEQKTRRK